MKKRTRLFAIILVMSLLLSAITVLVSALDSASEGNTPSAEEIMGEALVMKVNSYNALRRGTKDTLVRGTEATPYKNGTAVMVPLLPVAEFAGATCSVAGANSYSVTLGGKTFTVTAGQTETGTVTTLSAAPEMKTFGSTSVMYIAREDVEKLFDEFYVTYDESGLIYVSKYPEFVNRNDDEELMYTTAKQFIYTGIDFRSIVGTNGKNIMTVDYLGKSGSAGVNYQTHTASFVNAFKDTDAFQELYNMFSEGTNEFTHPYIKTTQAKFDELHANYTATADYDEELRRYIDEQIAYADKYITAWATVNNNGSVTLKEGQWNYDSNGKANEGLPNPENSQGWNTTLTTGTNHSVSQMPYTEGKSPTDVNYGYDPVRESLNILSNSEGCLVAALEPVALAYQITRDAKYLDFAYKWMTALCSWEHWGPGHFLNCANTARPLATAYDWLYNDFARVYGQAAVDDLATRIYENAVYEAQITLTGLWPEHGRSSGDSSRYYGAEGNWNPVCTLGMLVASLAVMGEKGGEYKDEALYVIAASLAHYMERGMSYVTLDGGYVESAGYWAAVGNMHMITKVLMDTAGTDFGLLDYPGIDTADYFGCQMEGTTYVKWNYHDDSLDSVMPSHWYYLSADLYDNPAYAAMRYKQIHNEVSPKSTHRFDLLFYDKETIKNIDEVVLPSDYSMTSIDATVVHSSSWDPNTLFAGIMGGMNNVEHGQHDSGNWIYENMGVRWFVDLGRDNYGLYGNRFTEGYYRYSAEGNNTLALTSDENTLPQGQAYAGSGELVSFTNNEYGSATIIDQNSVYAGLTEYARRGMLLTNDRRTFVIQDEVKTVDGAKETFYWFAHYDTNAVLRIKISDDGRTAYMYAPNAKGEFHTLRVTLLSGNKDLKFEIMDTHTFVLDYTKEAGYSPAGNGVSEDPRDNYMKLAVKAENVSELKMAVVVEVVTTSMDSEVGYSLVPMDGWQAEKGPDISDGGDTPIYTVHYSDGTEKDFSTSRLYEGLYGSTDDKGEKWTDPKIVQIDCKGNVIFDSVMNITPKQNITINLNGNLLYQTQNNGLRVGAYGNGAETSLTVNDGEWYSRSLIQLRTSATLILNRMECTFVKTAAIRNEGGRVEINESSMEANVGLMFIAKNANTTAAKPNSLVINNSNIKSPKSFIDFSGGSDTGTNYLNVYVFGGSSVSIPDYEANKLVANTGSYENVTANFFIEDGTRLDFEGFALPDNVSTDTVNNTYNLTYCTEISVSDSTVSTGTAMIPYDSNATDSDSPMYLISETEDVAYPYVVMKVTPTFTAYYTDGTDKSFYSSNIASALPTDNTDNGVSKIVLLSDAYLSTEAKLGSSQQLIIDLSGYTLYSTAGRITMGPYTVSNSITCSVTVLGKGGKIVKTGGDGFCARLGTTLIFDNVSIDSTSSVVWDNGAKTIVFNNCENVTASGKLIDSRYGVVNTVEGKPYHNIVINNSNVNVDGVVFGYAGATAEKTSVDLYVIGSSKVTYDDMYSYGDNTAVLESVHNVHVEEGALLSNESFLPENTTARYGEVFAYESISLNGDYTVGECVEYPSFRVVESNGFYTVGFMSMTSGIKSTLTLYVDFTVNFYIPVEGNVIDRVVINGTTHVIDGNTQLFTDKGVTYYKLSVKNIAANSAAEDIELSFCSDSYVENKTFSVIEYCERLMSDGRYKSSYRLAASVVKYVSAAYDYTGAEKPENLTSILGSDSYILYLPEPMPVTDSAADFGNIGVALHGAQLDLGSNLKFRFNFNTVTNNNGNAFTGTIYVNGVKYTVIDGQCGGNEYVTVEMRAFDMYDPEKFITISGVSDSGQEFSGTYDLRAYINHWENVDSEDADIMAKREELLPFMSALYTYCTESYCAKYGVEIERPSRGDMPYVDAGI